MNKTIHELNSLTQAQADDELIIYDVSEGESKKIQVQALNNPNYSTTEQKTGGTWIDGKPIYKKVITDLSISTSNSYVTLMSVGDIDTIIKTSGMTTNNKTNFALDSVVNGANIQIRTTYSTQLINTVILEYTKTTD